VDTAKSAVAVEIFEDTDAVGAAVPIIVYPVVAVPFNDRHPVRLLLVLALQREGIPAQLRTGVGQPQTDSPAATNGTASTEFIASATTGAASSKRTGLWRGAALEEVGQKIDGIGKIEAVIGVHIPVSGDNAAALATGTLGNGSVLGEPHRQESAAK